MKTDRQILRAYLLGTLLEDLAMEVDVRLFEENELHLALQNEQDALIEDFVYGLLTQEEEVTFQSQYERSPLLQEKVESFRVFLSALERQSDPLPSPRVLRSSRFFILFSPALAFMLCVTSFLYMRELHSNAILSSQLQSTSHALEAVAPPISGSPVSVVAFLSANVPRGSSAAPEIRVPATASVLELQVEVRIPVSAEADWDGELLRDDQVIWTSAHLPMHRIGHEVFFRLLIDTESIHAGSYVVRYSPHSEPGAAQFRYFYILN